MRLTWCRAGQHLQTYIMVQALALGSSAMLEPTSCGGHILARPYQRLLEELMLQLSAASRSATGPAGKQLAAGLLGGCCSWCLLAGIEFPALCLSLNLAMSLDLLPRGHGSAEQDWDEHKVACDASAGDLYGLSDTGRCFCSAVHLTLAKTGSWQTRA